jgi:Secretion system C-terminal sorting domain
MKKLYFLLFTLSVFTAQLIAQTDGITSPEDVGKGPVIDNISADIKFDAGVNVDGSNATSFGSSVFDDDGKSSTVAVNAENLSDLRIIEQLDNNGELAAIVDDIRSNMKFYPNPVVNDLNVDLGIEINIQISIMNIIGQEMFSFSGSFQEIIINMSDYPVGSYFLKIRIGSEIIVKRIEKLN